MFISSIYMSGVFMIMVEEMSRINSRLHLKEVMKWLRFKSSFPYEAPPREAPKGQKEWGAAPIGPGNAWKLHEM